jgi:DNA-binding response OmpR family regulator
MAMSSLMKDGKGTPLKILVIEDDPDILNALNIALGSMGFEVHVLMNGKCVLDNQFVLPDLFILDKRLPDIDGLKICKFLKAHPAITRFP